MASDSGRWVEVTSSQFAHEADGLDVVRRLLPDETPYRAWSNFEFRDAHGRWHEVDLLVLARDGFHLVELKYYSGTIRGNDLTWLRDGHRAEDSPLKLARRKAQYFASKLKDAYEAWVREKRISGAAPARDVIPWVQESVFLHHDRVRVELPDAARRDLYGLDGAEGTSGLPGISSLLSHPSGTRRPIGPNAEAILVDLLARIGLVQRREREAGSWVLEGGAIAEGDGWQDWLATHKVSQTERRRIRFQTLPTGASVAERHRARQLAEHEYRTLRRLTHQGVLQPDDLVECDLGIGLVYPYDPDQQPLDLWLADRPSGVPLETQLAIVRQVGDALAYAHSNRLVHRGLSPRAVLVSDKGGRLRVTVADWQSVGAVAAAETPTAGVTALFGTDALTPTSDGERWLHEGFAAPEGAFGRAVDRVRLDVFGLGALAFYVFAGVPAVRTAAELRERLRRQDGLDVSIERPEASPALREAVLRATRPRVSDRTADVSGFLAGLDASEAPDPEIIDPLDAAPGALLGGRFTLQRRLGAGSTAVGLLVSDATAEGQPDRVLKVALDDRAAARLADEAEVLAKVRSPRLVALIEGPLLVGGRQSLLLTNAGTDTLAMMLRQRPRLSLDLLERWGTDLLEALLALDRAGVDHRDIKPSNLGVLENRGNREKHLVLFDFSLSKAAASATQAGTPPYLDPFLGGKRDRFDSAAERYSAAVVLFEMATGHTPLYGDGLSDPAVLKEEATIEASDFDPAVGAALVGFFRRALTTDAKRRHDTAADMLRAWKDCFSATVTTVTEDAGELAAAATVETPLLRSGLSARALSALEPFGVQTVGDLLAVDPARLSRLSGTAEATRRQIKQRAAEWRKRLGAPQRPRSWKPVRPDTQPGPHDIAEQLLAVARAGRNATRASLVTYLLGLGGAVDAFATQGLLAASLPEPVTAARANQLLADLQEAWAEDAGTLATLQDLHDKVAARLAELGGVATAAELTTFLAGEFPNTIDDETRLVEGLLRLIIDRSRAVARGGGDAGWTTRRREGQPLLVADDPILLDVAEALGQAADRLVAGVNGDGHDVVVPEARAGEALLGVLGRAVVPDPLRDAPRLVRLAAATSRRCGASATNDLHDLDLAPARALALTLPAVAAGQTLDPAEIRDRVRARFPALAPLPERPGLDRVVDEANIGLIWDEGPPRRFRPVQAPRDTTGLATRHATLLAPDPTEVALHGATAHRLAESLSRRSFLVLGVPATHLDRAPGVLGESYGADVLDLSETLIVSMRRLAAARGLPWQAALGADAEPAASRPGQGLRSLVSAALPAVTDAIGAALAAPGDGPLVLTEPALLARFDAVKPILGPWLDLATSRLRAMWLVVPQLYANQGAVVDGRPLPLAAPGQFLRLDADWIDARRTLEGSPA
jgi:serine/threonine protein kinase